MQEKLEIVRRILADVAVNRIFLTLVIGGGFPEDIIDDERAGIIPVPCIYINGPGRIRGGGLVSGLQVADGGVQVFRVRRGFPFGFRAVLGQVELHVLIAEHQHIAVHRAFQIRIRQRDCQSAVLLLPGDAGGAVSHQRQGALAAGLELQRGFAHVRRTHQRAIDVVADRLPGAGETG